MILYVVLILLTLLYIYVRQHFNFWKNKNVVGPDPILLIGNVGSCLIWKKSFAELFADLYRKYEELPFFGIFKSWTPCLIVKDPEFIRAILVKDFKHFTDNDIEVDKVIDPLFGRNPFVLKGAEWRHTRSLLTSSFTSGKMKLVYPLIVDVSQRMIRYIKENKNPLEAKELCTKFTLDNVGSCAFGINANCFDDPKADFRDIAHKFLSPDSVESFKFLLMLYFPQILKYVKVKFVRASVEKRITDIVIDTLKYRKENNIVRNDFLHYTNELKNSSKTSDFTDLDVAAHAAGFFGDGFETSSIVMSFLLFELAMNPRTQERVRKEINDMLAKNNSDEVTYDNLQEMPYLEACYNESARKNTVVHALVKQCTEKYTYKTVNTDEYKDMSVTLNPGDSLTIPIEALHHDPKFFPEPEKFKPERFLPESKDTIRKFTFLPFGEGPRQCLGQKFGVMQVKAGIAQIIRKFNVTVNEKTKLPLQYDKLYFMLSPIGGLWLDYKEIN